jgi:PadR family transcriptional regulator
VARLSVGAVSVLHAVAGRSRFGFDIMAATGLTSGTVYPTLDKLEQLGFLSSRWEDEAAAHREGRPARRYFRLTTTGAAALEASLLKYKTFRPVAIDWSTVEPAKS